MYVCINECKIAQWVLHKSFAIWMSFLFLRSSLVTRPASRPPISPFNCCVVVWLLPDPVLLLMPHMAVTCGPREEQQSLTTTDTRFTDRDPKRTGRAICCSQYDNKSHTQHYSRGSWCSTTVKYLPPDLTGICDQWSPVLIPCVKQLFFSTWLVNSLLPFNLFLFCLWVRHIQPPFPVQYIHTQLTRNDARRIPSDISSFFSGICQQETDRHTHSILHFRWVREPENSDFWLHQIPFYLPLMGTGFMFVCECMCVWCLFLSILLSLTRLVFPLLHNMPVKPLTLTHSWLPLHFPSSLTHTGSHMACTIFNHTHAYTHIQIYTHSLFFY